MQNKFILYIAVTMLSFTACSKLLDIEPRNKIQADAVLSDANGLRSFLADLYYQAPVEDFVYFPRAGFNARGNTGSLSLSQYGMEAIHSEWPNWNEWANDWWEKGYKLNRSINILMDAVPGLDLSDKEKNNLLGEAHFLKAYSYFELAKRYGGVPLIDKNQQYTTDFESLRVPRSTEKETWDYVLSECDKAIDNLPDSYASADETKRRATKWAAYALKSRVALFAASLCKYWNKAPLSGEAVDKKLVGMSSTDANSYYLLCIEASEAIINSGRFSLYKPDPSSPAEAAKNFQDLFTDPNIAPTEVIFLKGYGKIGEPLAHDYDGWNNPNQIGGSFPYRGRTNPILELVDQYEDYTNPGHASPIITTADGKVSDNNGYSPSTNYLEFDKPEDIFKNKDARFFASIIYPDAIWKSTKIIIQGGIVRHDGTLMDSRGSYQYNGTTYYTYGKEQPNQYSGFDGSANDTRSGFLLRKFLNEDWEINAWLQSTTDYADIRYAEVLLNYAEAVIESGNTEKNAKAAELLNSIRFRAAHTVAVPLTLDNILRERKVELAFENKGFWDLIRRRTFHTIFNNKVKTALVPLLDLRGDTLKYIFVRKKVAGANPNTAQLRDYYHSIPGTAGNGVIQNPEY